MISMPSPPGQPASIQRFMDRFSVPLPRLPPTMKICFFSGSRPYQVMASAFISGVGGVETSFRMGLPLRTILSAGKNFSIPS